MTTRIEPAQFADGQPVAKSALRDTFTTIRDKFGETLSVKDFGAAGDGTTDDGPAFQEAINSGRGVYVPLAVYRIVTPLKIAPGQNCMLIGEGGASFHEEGRPKLIYEPIDTATDEPLLARSFGYFQKDNNYSFDRNNRNNNTDNAANILLKNLRFRAIHKYSSIVDLSQMRAVRVHNCHFEARFRGLLVGPECYDSIIEDCRFTSANAAGRAFDISDEASWNEYVNHGFACYASSHTVIRGIDINKYGTGLIAAGKGITIENGRYELCVYAIRISDGYINYSGIDRNRSSSAVHVSGISAEANRYGITIGKIFGGRVTGCDIQGTIIEGWDTSIGCSSDVGVWIKPGTRSKTLSVDNINCRGGFRVAAFLNDGAVPMNYADTPASKSYGAFSTPLLKDYATKEHAYHLVNYPAFPNAQLRSAQNISAFSDLMLRGLTGMTFGRVLTRGERAGSPAFAKNLGGVVNPASGAISASVRFFAQGNYGMGALDTPSIVDDPASTLELGVYHYVITTMTDRGETSHEDYRGLYYHKIQITETGKSVGLNPSNFWGFPRRIYRAQILPRFEGFWEFWPDDPRPFYDNGNVPFHGYGTPPSKGNWFPETQEEDDANYQILVQPSWHTTTVVTKKETTGFIIEFGTAAPDDEQSVTWLMFRP